MDSAYWMHVSQGNISIWNSESANRMGWCSRKWALPCQYFITKFYSLKIEIGSFIQASTCDRSFIRFNGWTDEKVLYLLLNEEIKKTSKIHRENFANLKMGMIHSSKQQFLNKNGKDKLFFDGRIHVPYRLPQPEVPRYRLHFNDKFQNMHGRFSTKI